jgi:hypothetical protein
MRCSTSCIHAVVLSCDCAQRLRGCLTVHPWTGSQLARILASHPAGLFSAAAPLHRGPSYCTSHAAKPKRIPASHGFHFGFHFGFGFGFGFGAQDARYKGPVSGGDRAQERPEGWARGIAPSSLPAHGGAVSEPPASCRGVAGQESGDHRFGVAFSLVTFSWPRKRKSLARREASEYSAGMPRSAEACFKPTITPRASRLKALLQSIQTDSLTGGRWSVVEEN